MSQRPGSRGRAVCSRAAADAKQALLKLQVGSANPPRSHQDSAANLRSAFLIGRLASVTACGLFGLSFKDLFLTLVTVEGVRRS